MAGMVLTENRDGVLLVTLNRPEKKNAVNNEMWVALREAFESAEADPGVVCLVLAGAGEDFCAGVDLASFVESGSQEEGEPHRAVVLLHRGLRDALRPREFNLRTHGHESCTLV